MADLSGWSPAPIQEPIAGPSGDGRGVCGRGPRPTDGPIFSGGAWICASSSPVVARGRLPEQPRRAGRERPKQAGTTMADSRSATCYRSPRIAHASYWFATFATQAGKKRPVPLRYGPQLPWPAHSPVQSLPEGRQPTLIRSGVSSGGGDALRARLTGPTPPQAGESSPGSRRLTCQPDIAPAAMFAASLWWKLSQAGTSWNSAVQPTRRMSARSRRRHGKRARASAILRSKMSRRVSPRPAPRASQGVRRSGSPGAEIEGARR